MAVARAFTGWTIEAPRAGWRLPVRCPSLHDEREKVVFGQVIGLAADRAMASSVLDILASHPSTARFIPRSSRGDSSRTTRRLR